MVAFAEMVALVGDRTLTRRLLARSRTGAKLISDEGALLTGIGAACELAEPLVLARKEPGPGRALDRFVEAHAVVRAARDSPGFRRELLAYTAIDRDPRIRRYWDLMGEVTGVAITPGALHSWLVDALERSVR